MRRVLLVGQEERRTKLGSSSKTKANSLLQHAEDLRNGLAHRQLNLPQGASWVAVLQRVEAIEAAVHTSDEAVEKKVAGLHGSHRDGLRL